MGDTPLGPHHRRAIIRPPAIARPTKVVSRRLGQGIRRAVDPRISFRVGGWDGMAAIVDLVKQTKGKFTGDEAIAFLSQLEEPGQPARPRSRSTRNTRDIVQNIYIREAKKVDGKLANVEIATIPSVKDPWKELNPPK